MFLKIAFVLKNKKSKEKKENKFDFQFFFLKKIENNKFKEQELFLSKNTKIVFYVFSKIVLTNSFQK